MTPDKLPDIKLDPRYGYFPRWPEDGDGWLHPDDAAAARGLIPSPRIWLKIDQPGEFDTIHSGNLVLRVKPALWQITPVPEFSHDDWVEVRPLGMKNEPHTGRIRSIEWCEQTGAIHYQITVHDKPLLNYYPAEELKPVEPPIATPEVIVEVDDPNNVEGVDELTEGLPVDDHRRPQ